MSYGERAEAVGVLETTVLSSSLCAASCSVRDKNCYGFNYKQDAKTCEVLSVSESSPVLKAPEAAENWTLYVREDFAQSPCSFPVCKTGSLCLLFPERFKPDSYEVPPSVWLRYTCSSHSYLIDKQQAGNPNCRFDQIVNKRLTGHDISPYNPGRENYAAVLGYCDAVAGNPCLSLESQSRGNQFLKNTHHLSQPNISLGELTDAAFFYADCFP
ncbi:hypothetical protein FHG87_022063 [Trinorchestia longiramus]|nr:hypothetical protein FHG87_022063 [Trinorchestia longiramus]